MIETALVYIYSVAPASEFVGCGALIEGGYIATCRHVWIDAIEEAGHSEAPQVQIAFPFARDDSPELCAELADFCEGLDKKNPDLVLLRPNHIPQGIMSLQLARQAQYEIGDGQCHCYLRTKDIDSFINGKISGKLNAKGLRQFTGDNGQSHWMEKGSSGSPVFFQNEAQQLVGIIALAELGANQGETHLREAFIVPATTIHKYYQAYVEKLAALEQAQKRDKDPGQFQPLLDRLRAQNVPDTEIGRRLDAAVEAMLAEADKPVAPSDGGSDIEATLAAARRKLGDLDTAGAHDLLNAKLAEEEQERVRRKLPLLTERAKVERLSFDYDAAKKTLVEITWLAPDDVWAFIDLGDLFVKTGGLDSAARAFQNAAEAARRIGHERDLSVSLNRIGDVQVAQGQRDAALQSCEAAHAIAERLMQADPNNAERQRDLWVSLIKIGDMQVAQGQREAALLSYEAAHAIAERLMQADPNNAERQRDLSVSYDRIGGVQVAQGQREAALRAFEASRAIRERLAQADSNDAEQQRDLSVSLIKIGDMQVAQGQREAALLSYEAARTIAKRLTQADPKNTDWQRDLSVFLNRVGDVQVAQGQRDAAIQSYEAARTIAERLANADPNNANWQRDLIVSYNRIADCDPSNRRTHLARALEIAKKMDASGQLAPADAWMPADLARLIAELDGNRALCS